MPQANRERFHRERLRVLGQDHVLAYWDVLDETERAELIACMDRIPYDALERVREAGVEALAPRVPPPDALTPVEPVDLTGPDPELRRAREAGRRELRAGRVAAITLAGGQGTRLGFSGPKGTYPIEADTGRSFFHILGEAVREESRRAGRAIAWYVMTSDATHEETQSFFDRHEHFGLDVGQVRLFRQGSLPSLGLGGRLMLADEHRLAMSPDGHGGLLEALEASGQLERMGAEGTKYLSVFQVDNPLVRWFDPTFLGLHVLHKVEVSCKVIGKREDGEGLGNVCVHEGRTVCVEYSDFPREHASARNADGTRRFDAGNISIYVIGVDFLASLVDRGVRLPVHLARKKVVALDPSTGRREEPEEPNGYKMERFVFDLLPLARSVLVAKTRREAEFSPVKTLTGPDSVESCRRALARIAAEGTRK
jgi:UDP-N-acetylglucosamine/UDP-N-acetylgalactosamine diphosphorylase